MSVCSTTSCACIAQMNLWKTELCKHIGSHYGPIYGVWTERQSARMSKNEKGGLDQYGPEHFGRPILSQSEKVWDWKG